MGLSPLPARSGPDCADRDAIRVTARVENPLGITALKLTADSPENTTGCKSTEPPAMYFYAGSGGAQITLESDRNEDKKVIFREGKISELTASDILDGLPSPTGDCTLTVIRTAD